MTNSHASSRAPDRRGKHGAARHRGRFSFWGASTIFPTTTSFKSQKVRQSGYAQIEIGKPDNSAKVPSHPQLREGQEGLKLRTASASTGPAA